MKGRLNYPCGQADKPVFGLCFALCLLLALSAAQVTRYLLSPDFVPGFFLCYALAAAGTMIGMRRAWRSSDPALMGTCYGVVLVSVYAKLAMPATSTLLGLCSTVCYSMLIALFSVTWEMVFPWPLSKTGRKLVAASVLGSVAVAVASVLVFR